MRFSLRVGLISKAGLATAIIWLPDADITCTSPVKGNVFKGVLDSVIRGLCEEDDKSIELLFVESDFINDLSKAEPALGTSSSGPVF